jgi:CheY-like chemotaxis protein
MNKFVTLLVEDDVLQREILADVLKGDGFEVVECSTAEAAELVIATSGTELRALIADHLEGKMVGSELA